MAVCPSCPRRPRHFSKLLLVLLRLIERDLTQETSFHVRAVLLFEVPKKGSLTFKMHVHVTHILDLERQRFSFRVFERLLETNALRFRVFERLLKVNVLRLPFQPFSLVFRLQSVDILELLLIQIVNISDPFLLQYCSFRILLRLLQFEFYLQFVDLAVLIFFQCCFLCLPVRCLFLKL